MADIDKTVMVSAWDKNYPKHLFLCKKRIYSPLFKNKKAAAHLKILYFSIEIWINYGIIEIPQS